MTKKNKILEFVRLMNALSPQKYSFVVLLFIAVSVIGTAYVTYSVSEDANAWLIFLLCVFGVVAIFAALAASPSIPWHSRDLDDWLDWKVLSQLAAATVFVSGSLFGLVPLLQDQGLVETALDRSADKIAEVGDSAERAASTSEETNRALKEAGVIDRGGPAFVRLHISGIWGEAGCAVRYRFNLSEDSLTIEELDPPAAQATVDFLFVNLHAVDQFVPRGPLVSILTATEKRGLNPGSSNNFTLTDHGEFQSVVWDSSDPDQATLELERCPKI